MAKLCRMWQFPHRTMQPVGRRIIGVITSTAWLGAGGYTILYGADETWKLVGYVVVGVGVLRAYLLIRDWNKVRRLPAGDDRED